MIVSEIAPECFDALLRTSGIRIETSPFAFRISGPANPHEAVISIS